MIDLNDLRARPEIYEEACRKKRVRFSVREFLVLDEEYRSAKTALENLRAEQNRVSRKLPSLGKEEKASTLTAMKGLSQSVKELADSFRVLEEKWQAQTLHIPSVPLSDVPEGNDDSQNVPVRTWGETPQFAFAQKDHVTIGEKLKLLDIERGVKVAGARQYFLMGDGVLLNHAIFSYALDFLVARGFTPMSPPHLVNYKAMMGTGYFPGGEESAYQLDDRDAGTFLIGTSEVPLCAFHTDEIFDLDELPKRYAGISPCYRREAGTYGKDAHGLYRVHQFQKIEQVIMCIADEEQSLEHHNELLSNAEDFLQSLELPYRVVTVCTGDMGQGQVCKHDIECWMPSRGAYGETHSCSSFYAFQSRRLGIRYRADSGKNVNCYTLNNTLIATPRVLIPLLEVHQQENGTVRIPEVLRPYLSGKEYLGGE